MKLQILQRVWARPYKFGLPPLGLSSLLALLLLPRKSIASSPSAALDAEVAERLLAAGVRAGGSRHVVAATAVAMRRQCYVCGRPALPSVATCDDVLQLEEAMAVAGLRLGPVGVGQAVVNARAAVGSELAARLRRA